MFLPPDIVKGRHVYFAIDNIDFSKDTPDGKRTLHGTAMAIYQKVEPQDEEPVLGTITVLLRSMMHSFNPKCSMGGGLIR